MWNKLLHITAISRILLCLFLGSISSASAQESLTLNFNNTDISAVIAAVSQMTGRNFIVDPRVKGKVTVISNHGMGPEEVYQVFLSILKVHGYAVIPGANVTKIVPEVNAKQDAVGTSTSRQPGRGDEFVTRVVEIKHVDAAQLVPILRPLVPQRGHLAAYPSSNVLIISDSAANINRLVDIIQRIDLSATDEIEVIPLEHASASELVRIVNQLDKAGKGAAKKLKLVADDRTNSILLSGDKTARLRIRALISHLDTPMDVGGNTQVVYLRNAVAKDLVSVLTGISQSAGKAAGQAANAQQGKVNIQADENTNALVITAPPDLFRSLRSVIQKLDVRRAQVKVETVIADVSSDASRELGVQWGAAGPSGSDDPVGVISFNQGRDIQGLLTDPPSVSDGLNLGFGKFTKGAFRFAGLIRALAADANTNVLSTPTLVTMDNEEAEIVVGQNVPFLTGQYTSTGSSSNPSNPFSTVERQDVGITLKIKPQINEGNAIKMDVVQEVSSIAPSSVGVDLITNKRSIKTSVMIEDGQALVLGGLIKDDLLESEQRVPGLGDIPIVGWLFKYKKVQKIKTNLMVFMHPLILKDAATTASVTNDKYSFMRARQMKLRENGLSIMDSDEVPVLQDMKDWLTLPPPYEEVQSNMPKVPTPPNAESLPSRAADVTPAGTNDVEVEAPPGE